VQVYSNDVCRQHPFTSSTACRVQGGQLQLCTCSLIVHDTIRMVILSSCGCGVPLYRATAAGILLQYVPWVSSNYRLRLPTLPDVSFRSYPQSARSSSSRGLRLACLSPVYKLIIYLAVTSAAAALLLHRFQSIFQEPINIARDIFELDFHQPIAHYSITSWLHLSFSLAHAAFDVRPPLSHNSAAAPVLADQAGRL
jgi:hypothetical protein